MHVANFAEAPDTVPQNLREVAPHIFLAVPRVWEKLYSAITIQIKEGTALGRLAYKGAIAHRLQGQRLRARGQAGAGTCAEPPARSATGWCSRTSACVLGLDRIRWAITGAAPISPDLIAWYWAMGVKMYEVYGQTENAGLATSNYPGHLKVGTIGQAAAGHRAQAVAAGRDPAARARTSSRATSTSPRRRPRR